MNRRSDSDVSDCVDLTDRECIDDQDHLEADSEFWQADVQTLARKSWGWSMVSANTARR